MIKGLVIGKFYPPHKGHSYLIEEARTHADELTVIVCEREGESIPGALRAGWIRDMHPGVKVVLLRDALSDTLEGNTAEEISKKWADYTITTLGYAPDVVCTSEEYGARWARYMGSRHVLVDIDRKRFPVSGTKVRNNPLEYWEFIAQPVRDYFIANSHTKSNG